jgi:hypothetical protein
VRKRSYDNGDATAMYPNKMVRQSFPPAQQYAYAPLPLGPPQQWPGVPPSRFVPWPGQGPPPPGWNAVSPVVTAPVQWPTPVRSKPPRIKGTCFDYVEKGVCLRGAAVCSFQ